MNIIARTRLKLFLVILAVIIAAHILAIKLIMSGGAAPAKEVPPSPPPAVKKVEAPAAAESKPGFWKRLFGSSDKKTEGKTEAAAALPAAPPPPTYRYKKPTGNPGLGKPFDYRNAVRGDLTAAQAPGSDGADTGLLLDLSTRKVLWAKEADKPVPIASMVKLMTLLVAMEELEENPKLSLETPVQITKVALSTERTGIAWLDPRESFQLGELLKVMTIRSYNDVAMQVAEFIGGDVETFILRMNIRGRSLGLNGAKFVSPCGLKDKKLGNSLVSANDMLLIAEQLLEYPQTLEWSSTQSTSIREGEKKTMVVNTNHLVNPRWPGVDGMKTGFTNDAGFCLVFSVLRDNRRMLGCVTGFKTARDRDRFCRKLIDWGYAAGPK